MKPSRILTAMLLICLFFICLFFICLFFTAWSSVRATKKDATVKCSVYTVQKGDTLWSIASKAYPGEHTGQKVHEIRKINGLKDPILQVGQVILLPKEG